MPCSPGQRPAGVDARGEDLRRQLLSPGGLAFDRAVVEHQRVQVAVAGVEDVADAKPVSRCQLRDPAQRVRQPRAGHDAVLHVVVATDPTHGGEGGLAAAPETRPLALRPGPPHLGRPRLAAHLDHPLQHHLDLDRGSIQLDQQHGAGVERKAGADRGLGGVNRQLVHHLDRRRDDASGDDRRHRLTGVVCGGEGGQQRLNPLRASQHADHHLGDDAERPLGADERRPAGRAHLPRSAAPPRRRPAPVRPRPHGCW